MEQRRRVLIGTLVVALAVVAGSIGYLAVTRTGPFAPPTVSFDLCSLTLPATFQYEGNSSGFLSNGITGVPQYCEAVTAAPGSTTTLGLMVHNVDQGDSHSILHLAVLSPYTLRGTSPSLPAVVAPGGNLSFGLTVGLPTTPGTYPGPVAVVTAE